MTPSAAPEAAAPEAAAPGAAAPEAAAPEAAAPEAAAPEDGAATEEGATTESATPTEDGAAADARPAPAFDPEVAWALHERVALRPERFGALAYHFGTRRLSFLKSPTLLRVVQALAEHPTAREACRAECADDLDARRHERALATLAATDMIRRRDPKDRG